MFSNKLFQQQHHSQTNSHQQRRAHPKQNHRRQHVHPNYIDTPTITTGAFPSAIPEEACPPSIVYSCANARAPAEPLFTAVSGHMLVNKIESFAGILKPCTTVQRYGKQPGRKQHVRECTKSIKATAKLCKQAQMTTKAPTTTNGNGNKIKFIPRKHNKENSTV